MKALNKDTQGGSGGGGAGAGAGAGAANGGMPGSGSKFAARNPMFGRASGGMPNADVDKNNLSMQDADNLPMQLEMDPDHKANLEKVQRPLPKLALAVISALREVFKRPRLQDFLDSIFKRQILLHRACCAILRRFELIVGSMVLHIILALLFAWINKNINAASNIAYFGMSAMFLIMANVQFIFFIYTNHHVSAVCVLVCILDLNIDFVSA